MGPLSTDLTFGDGTTVLPDELSDDGSVGPLRRSTRAALVITWARDEPERVGELLLLPGGPSPRLTVGRGR